MVYVAESDLPTGYVAWIDSVGIESYAKCPIEAAWLAVVRAMGNLRSVA